MPERLESNTGIHAAKEAPATNGGTVPNLFLPRPRLGEQRVPYKSTKQFVFASDVSDRII